MVNSQSNLEIDIPCCRETYEELTWGWDAPEEQERPNKLRKREAIDYSECEATVKQAIGHGRNLVCQ